MTTILSVQNLHYAYPTYVPDQEKVWVLKGVDLDVEEGEFLAIMGPTGVGKTTLCLAFNGSVPQSTGGTIKGKVNVDGLDSKEYSVPRLAQRVGLVFQDAETQLFNMTVEAEVAFGLETMGLPVEEIEERIEWSLAEVGMGEFRTRSPYQLSGGQKQRVAIASILAMTPKILVLDEPTANLDPSGKAEVFSVVRRLRRERGMTILMVEHESEHIAEFADRIAVLEDGRVEIVDSPAKVFAQTSRMREIGLAVPQVTELADCLNRDLKTDFRFIRMGEAQRGLKDALDDISG